MDFLQYLMQGLKDIHLLPGSTEMRLTSGAKRARACVCASRETQAWCSGANHCEVCPRPPNHCHLIKFQTDLYKKRRGFLFIFSSPSRRSKKGNMGRTGMGMAFFSFWWVFYHGFSIECYKEEQEEWEMRTWWMREKARFSGRRCSSFVPKGQN